MLKKRFLNEQTYEDRIVEAISQIPVYSNEWTNFNPSDPGITILENLSLFTTLQQDHIGDIPATVKKALLKMAGFEAGKGRPARVLLACDGINSRLKLRKGQVFTVADMKFESIRDMELNGYSVRKVFSVHEGEKTDLGDILNRNIPIATYAFGEKPETRDAIYFICDGLPAKGEEAIFYFEVAENNIRNRFDGQNQDLFSKITWQVYTDDGFKEVHSKDSTGGFIFSGELRLRMPDQSPAIFEDGEHKGYCFRAILNEESYDIPPKIMNLYGFLTEVWQMDTRAFSKTSQRNSSIELDRKYVDNNYISVFVREGKGSSYRQYFPSESEEQEGRVFDIAEENDIIEYRFNKGKHGFGPEKCRNCIRILGYSEEIMQKYKIGVVYGNDDQLLELPLKRIVADSFFVVARREVKGELFYDFVRPNHKGEGDLYYTLDENNGCICIKEAGNFIGATILMGACAVYNGADGNVRKFNIFKADGLSDNIKFYNPAEGEGGRYQESLESLRERFVNDIDTPFAAVTEQDYENLVLNMPGLCIRKAKAYIEPRYNRVTVAVMPGINDRNGQPVLTDDYREKILKALESRKLLTTKVDVQKPVFVPVNVMATIYVKQHFDNTDEIVAECIRENLNFIDSDKNIGTPARFMDVFAAIENLSCVEYIYKLMLRPARGNLGRLDNEDVVPERNGIIVPGKISIETIVYRG